MLYELIWGHVHFVLSILSLPKLSLSKSSRAQLSGPAKHSDGVLGFLTPAKGLLGPAKHRDEILGFSNPRPKDFRFPPSTVK
ncbi:Hypothetical protein FKW44_018725 [Caligus rogercresseyi]|uniref:Uncharacterized protein n=1 Tax=Caligus rogercresseyi TaxID=217165 RepID=A0A7T8GUY8_CALRO|nr:Hypothetical protein FKW44_018725 [Caligus rogercresseyi]